MTGVAVLKVDDLGRRPLLIGGVGGLVRNSAFWFISELYLLKLISTEL